MTNRRDFLKSLPHAAAIPATLGMPSEPRFRLGSITYNVLKDHDLEGVIRILEATGFEGVELRTGHKHGVEPSLSTAERTRIRTRFEKSKVRLVGYGTTCEFHSPDAAERKKQVDLGKQFVDLARDTGATGIKVRPNGLPAGVPHPTTIANIGACLRELGEYGAGKRIEIWMEVHGRDTSEPKVAAAIMQAARHSNAALCWNSNNADIVDGSVKASFELLRPWVKHVHIHDIIKDNYPYRELFTLLAESGYDRYTMCEVGAGAADPEAYLRAYRTKWVELTR